VRPADLHTRSAGRTFPTRTGVSRLVRLPHEKNAPCNTAVGYGSGSLEMDTGRRELWVRWVPTPSVAARLKSSKPWCNRTASLSPNKLSTIPAICRRLDGIPLATEFAAARAASLGVVEVLSGLDDRFALLTGGRQAALPKRWTLRATLDWSRELLTAPERVQLRHQATFAAPFSLAAASEVAVNDKAPSPDIADGTANLVAKSLVTADNIGPVVRLRLLESTRVHAFEKLTRSGELQQSARRHAEYYRRTLERTEDDPAAMPGHIADLGNAHAALEWCFGVNGDPELGVGLAAAAMPTWFSGRQLTKHATSRVE
jgi:predicted ATPase